MIAEEPWYWKKLDPYLIFDEDVGEIVGFKEGVPEDAKKAYEADIEARRKYQEEHGCLIG